MSGRDGCSLGDAASSPQKFRQDIDVGFHLDLASDDLVSIQISNTMALERSARPLARCLRCTRHNRIPSRSISATPWRSQEETPTTEPPSSAEPPPPPPPSAEIETDALGTINPETVSNPRRERRLVRDQAQQPIGSRRRRAALASSANIPFEELPYQCFQEARRVLQTDRAEKVTEIEELRSKIAKWSAAAVPPEREAIKEKRLKSWTKEIERLKVLADINDPLVKKRFEDGFGTDLNLSKRGMQYEC